MEDVTEIMALHKRLVERRRPYEMQWQEVAERVQPDQAIFNLSQSPGGKRTQKMFDSTAALALPRYAAAIDDMVTPRTKRWHALRTGIKALDDKQSVKEYLQMLVDILFAARYAPQANFATQSNSCYQSSGAYGEGVLFVDDMLGRGIRYRAIHLSELYIARNFMGLVDLVHRSFKYTARQAVQAFGLENLPKCVQDAASDEPMKEFNFVHCVGPNPKWDESRAGKEWKFYSTYVCTDEAKVVRSGKGYNCFPYAFASGIYVPGEDYSRGVMSLVLPDIKQLNEMEKTMLRQSQLAVDPSILLSEDGSLTGFAHQPGALMWGGLNEDGEPLAKPFQTGANLSIGFEMAEQKRRVINDACLLTLFQILVDKPNMTATEAMFRAQEKGALMAPDGGRKQSEFVGSIIPRELEILGLAGELPPLPPELVEAGFDLTMLHVEYVSPLNQAQQADEGIAISRTLETAGIVAQYDPTVKDMLKTADIFRRFGEINGMPANLIKSKEEMEKVEAQQAQQEQINQLLAAAPVAAESAKNFSQAQALAAASPTSQAPLVVPQG